MRQLHVHLLPSLVQPEKLAGAAVVVIDVLRATTTMITALAYGALVVVPCQEIDEARRLAAGLPAGTSLLGGERLGVRIDGFDLGNSPAEYAPQVVRGKTIVFTTTNGTRALQVCGQAAEVLFGAFVNLSALCNVLEDGERPIHLLCAGTQGRITREDVLLAGAVVARLASSSLAAWQTNDEAELAAAAWGHSQQNSPEASLVALMRKSRGGQNLISTGQEEDIEAAARIDDCAVVPVFDPQSGEIRLR